MTTPAFTRRQAIRLALSGSVALASTAIALSGPLASTIFARPALSPPVLLIGVRAGSIPAGKATSEAVPLLVRSMDLATGQVRSIPVPDWLEDGLTPVLRRNDAITGFAIVADGTLAAAITPLGGGYHDGEPTRVTRLGAPAATAVPISNVKSQEQLSSLTAGADGTLFGLVAKRNGTPPVRLVTIDPLSGAVADHAKVTLPKGQRFGTLAQCPDGLLYTTTMSNKGDTSLVQLSESKKGALTVPLFDPSGHAWNNGLASLVCLPTGQMLALGAPRYKTPNALYTVDMRTGVMTVVRDFDVVRVTVARA